MRIYTCMDSFALTYTEPNLRSGEDVSSGYHTIEQTYTDAITLTYTRSNLHKVNDIFFDQYEDDPLSYRFTNRSIWRGGPCYIDR